MNNKNVEINKRGNDDYLHQPGLESKWRESYYFNWVDLHKRISGFTTIGILPNQKQRELVFILFYDNKMEVYYKEPALDQDLSELNEILSDDRLSHELITPMDEWRISYESRKLDFEMTFKTRHSPFYFGEDSSGSWHQHFEASGKINGVLNLRGNEIKLEGYGQRDKSWGFRDWHKFSKWYAGHFQFDSWSGGFRKDYINNEVLLSGYIHREGKNIPISEIIIENEFESDKFESPIKATYSLTDSEGKKLKVVANRVSKNTFFRFAREFEGGYTELFEQMARMKNLETGEVGSGMFEQLRTKIN
jgi:hypothetical protein